jgi:peptidoglycan/xylan/chitin deacetylase (PgdA/CDA1 family)
VLKPFIKVLSVLRRKAGHAVNNAASFLGLYASFFRNARGARILIYHGICRRNPTRFNTIFVSAKTFESHLRFYRKYFNVISLDDYFSGRFRNDRFNICITFDDGFANNLTDALPLLEKYDMPAGFFVTAIREAGYDILWNDFVGILSRYGPAEIIFQEEPFRKNRFSRYISLKSGVSLQDMLRSGGFDKKAALISSFSSLLDHSGNKEDEPFWLQLTTDQIRELAACSKVTIGSHGYYHNDLSKIPAAEADRELRQSKTYLEKITGKEIKALAFPYGSYLPETVSAAKKTGYQQLLALDFYFRDDSRDPYLRERFTINPFVSVTNQMIAIVKRSYA